MANPAPVPAYRLKIPCADEHEFREKFATKYAASGIFVPAQDPLAVGTRVHIKLEFKNGQVMVSGDAMVTSRTTPEKADKPGMTMRLTALHPDSIKFEISPSVGSRPSKTQLAAVQGPALTPAPPTLSAALTPAPPRPAVTHAPPRPAVPPAPPSPTFTPAPPPRPALTPSPPARTVAPPSPSLAPPPPAPAPAAPQHSQRATHRDDLFSDDEEPSAPAADVDFSEVEPTPPGAPLLAATPEAAADIPAPVPEVPAREAPVLEPLASGAPARRPIAGRRITLRIAVAVAIVVVVAASAAAIASSRRRAAVPAASSARVAEELRIADNRLVEGRLTDAGGDGALDHLLAAQAAAPDDARVKTRLGLLADKFEQLGELALARKNAREAAVHFEAAVRADPARAGARKRLSEAQSAGSASSK